MFVLTSTVLNENESLVDSDSSVEVWLSEDMEKLKQVIREEIEECYEDEEFEWVEREDSCVVYSDSDGFHVTYEIKSVEVI